jgi:outer membrane receptor protein involved in Fe transport
VSPDRQGAATQPGSNVILGEEAVGRATTDAGDLIGRSVSATGVESQKRSPIANELRIRGHHLGQIVTQADGVFWFPARQDLDTFLSKIDSGIVRDIIVLKGPYSARYGPGFSFVDIETHPSPRFHNGLEWHGRTLLSYKFNGEQWYGRQTVLAGSDTWGFRVAYGHRTANDYDTGTNVEIPSSYNARDVDFVFGLDLSCDSHLELGYIRLDQTNLEFPGQIFDTRFLKTDAFRARYTLDNQAYFDRLTVDGWYNRTVLEGDAQRRGKRRQIPQLDQLGFTGITDIDLASTGFRVAARWGGPCEPQLIAGVDLRYLSGALNEIDQLFGIPCNLNFPIPPSHHSTYGGLFVEHALPLNDRLVIKMGGRGDWVATNVDGTPPGFCLEPGVNVFPDTAQRVLGTTDFARDFGLWLAYVTAEYKLNDQLTVVGGVGHGERAPTLTELYAIEPFLAILQQGFTSVVGNPGLDRERLWQIDLGLRADYGWFRSGVNGFYSWINDYITYAALDAQQGVIKIPGQLPNALSVRFVNTDLATLAGFELYGEMDATDWVTPFAIMSYVEGRDHSRDQRGSPRVGPGLGALGSPEEPLPGIPPLEARLGLRFHEPTRNPRYGLEGSARVVNSQDRVASSLGELRSAGFTVYDLRSFWQARQGLLLTAGVENLFDRTYREHLDLRTGLGVFQPGRNVYLGMELRY